jgi:hypothetical protein
MPGATGASGPAFHTGNAIWNGRLLRFLFLLNCGVTASNMRALLKHTHS